jgi:AcrR family transcriptional regulator
VTDRAARPRRADARANRERIVAAATRLFLERGIEVSLETVAEEAGLGSATLHRHFSGRLDLAEVVLQGQADQLVARADELHATHLPAAALATWLREVIAFSNSFRGLAVLLAGTNADASASTRHTALSAAGQMLLSAAQHSAVARTTIEISDLLKLVNGIAVASSSSGPVAERLLDLALHGVLLTPNHASAQPQAPRGSAL